MKDINKTYKLKKYKVQIGKAFVKGTRHIIGTKYEVRGTNEIRSNVKFEFQITTAAEGLVRKTLVWD